MGAKDKDKSGDVLPFDHNDREKTKHDKALAWHQRLRGYVPQNVRPERARACSRLRLMMVKQIGGTNTLFYDMV